MALVLAVFLVAAACTALEPALEDGRDDAFLVDGKSDTGGIGEGTPEALGVLRLANGATANTLQHEVGLSSAAAGNIDDYRLGDDGRQGTADDETFDSLRELDGVPYVGPLAFAKLLIWARAHGYVSSTADGGPPVSTDANPKVHVPTSLFDDTLASGKPITFDQARARFAPGATDVAVGRFALQQRVRSCNRTTGCTTWEYPVDVTFVYLTYELWKNGYSPEGELRKRACEQFRPATFGSVEGNMALVVSDRGRREIDLELESSVTGRLTCRDVSSGHALCDRFLTASAPVRGRESCTQDAVGWGIDPPAYPSTVDRYWEPGRKDPIRMRVLVTEEYVYARYQSSGSSDLNGTRREVEYALYGALGSDPLPPPAGTCSPATCRDQAKTCGTASDGCGGTLICGECQSPWMCGTSGKCELPQGCNLQPCFGVPSAICCFGGEVTCNDGCTCYDACL